MQNFIIGEMFSDIRSHYASVLLTLAMHETRLHHFVHTLSMSSLCRATVCLLCL